MYKNYYLFNNCILSLFKRFDIIINTCLVSNIIIWYSIIYIFNLFNDYNLFPIKTIIQSIYIIINLVKKNNFFINNCIVLLIFLVYDRK